MFTHSPQRTHFLSEKAISVLGSWVSGLWQKEHLKGHPLKKTTVRIPGPSSRLSLLTSTTSGNLQSDITQYHVHSLQEVLGHEAEFVDIIKVSFHLDFILRQ